MMNDKIVHSPKADEQEKDRSAKEHEDFSDDDSEGSAGDVPGVPVDALTRLRREKRLAMNRESARARRKRKKVLIETLEEHVAELTKRNQRFQAATENLTAKVNKLESDLAIARSTINILSNQSRPDLMGGHGHPQADLGLASAAGKQAELRRLIQAQALSQAQMSSGSGFNASFMDDARRRQALEMQALSQAGREGGMGSAFAARFSQSGIGYGGAPGLLSNASFNTAAASHDLPSELRLGMSETVPGMQGPGGIDALSPFQSRGAATSLMLRDYLKQGDNAASAEKKQKR